MKHTEAVAKSYAKALFALARERNQGDAIAAELEMLAGTIARQPALLDFFSRPWVAATVKRAAAVEVGTRLGLSPLMRDFLGLVALRGRADHLAAIAAAYRALDDEAKGRMRVKLRVAISLTDAERDELRRRLSRLLGGRELLIEERADEKLLGGFVAEVGSTILDGSLDNQLARIGERLAHA
jgi:F-type H+-transporting ATPase subunit delta